MRSAAAIVERDSKPENIPDDEREVVIRWVPDDDTARLRRVAGILLDILDNPTHSGGR